MKQIGYYFFLLLCVFLTAPCFAESTSEKLVVQVTGVEPAKGQVLLTLFSSPKNFLKKPVLEQKQTVGDTSTVVFILENIAAGTYAISIIYDKDKNGKLNTGFMGIPTEKVGFSNNAKGLFGPPSFHKAAFKYSGSENIVINVDKARKK